MLYILSYFYFTSKTKASILQRKEKKMEVSTINSWKSDFPWLLVKNETLFCKICISQKSIIELENYYNPAFTNGSPYRS